MTREAALVKDEAVVVHCYTTPVEIQDARNLAQTLKRLEAITAKVLEDDGVNLEPMQLAALLLEKTTEQISEDEAKDLVRPRRRASH